jgi:hypothetical protein
MMVIIIPVLRLNIQVCNRWVALMSSIDGSHRLRVAAADRLALDVTTKMVRGGLSFGTPVLGDSAVEAE